jgi:hypothetical protein
MLNECLSCTTRFAADLTQCPHCGSADYDTGGVQQMPKISEHGGPSDKRVPGYFREGRSEQSPNVTETDDERDYVERLSGDEPRPPKQDEKDEKEADRWPGNSSSRSETNSEKTGQQSRTSPQSPARSTVSPSKKDQAETSTARPGTSAGRDDSTK